MSYKSTIPALFAAVFIMTTQDPNLSAQDIADLKDGVYAEIETNHGKIVLNLEFEKCPLTVCSFVSLAEGKMDTDRKGPYYDGLVFHRIIKDFMLQGGCPQGSGTGGPGYKFAIEPPQRPYVRGSLAMANTGIADSNGSQFFISTALTPWLDGNSSTSSSNFISA